MPPIETQARPDAGAEILADLRPWFEWLDGLLARAAEAARQAFGDGSDPYRGLYVSHDDFDALLAGGLTSPLAYDGHPQRQNGEPQGGAARMDNVAARWGLNRFEAEALFVALAPEFEVRYERLYGYLQDDVSRKRPTVDLVLNLLCRSTEEKFSAQSLLSAEGKLVRSGLVQIVDNDADRARSDLARALAPDRAVVRYVLGQEALDSGCRWFAELVPPAHAFDELSSADEPARGVRGLIEEASRTGSPLEIALEGSNRSAKQAVAEAAATALGTKLVVADAGGASNSDGLQDDIRSLAVAARLHGWAVLVRGTEIFETNPSAGRAWSRVLADPLVRPDLVMIDSLGPWRAPAGSASDRASVAYAVRFDPPDYTSRKAHWKKRLVARGIGIDEADVAALAGRFRLSATQIDQALDQGARTAHVRSKIDGSESRPTAEDFYQAARAQSVHSLDAHARKITPRYGWADLVLPADSLQQLQEIRAHAEHRHRVYGEWGFDQKLSLGKGLNVLFSGPPGTGKTMAAEVIARALRLDLYRIDLSQIVSKYIGETEQNLNRVFEEARASNAILFFDEADALFGKRSEVRDAHDRYANIETAYLLQKMEEYEGVSILATNLRQNMDEAFTRRLSFTVEFPFPDYESRLRIWRSIWPREDLLAEGADLDFVARRFNLSGGSIKNVAVAAAFLAADDGGKVRTEHLLWATRREFQKMGRTLPSATFGEHAAPVEARVEAATT